MTAIVGYLAILVSLASAVWLVVAGFRGMLRPAAAVASRLKWPVYGLVGGAVVAMASLEVALLSDDFSISYVANNSTSSTPLLYKAASAWGALQGSIVLWGLVLAVFTLTVYWGLARREGPDPLGAGALAVLGIVSMYFFALMASISNPFAVCVMPASVGCLQASNVPWATARAALEGRGPNPLLQNHPLMAVHPPTLYIGYVGLTVPFAFAMSALMRGSSGTEWLRRTRSWTLVTWMFLTLGIVVGGLWSYEVLGWGGFWAWDPVENASFLPWLVATAFLHSSVVQARRGMLQAWNFILVIAAFALTILGTFLTRSGVINSVHAFSQSPIGPALLWFLMVVLVASFGLFAARVHLVASSPRLDSLASREGVFLGNNLLLTVFAFIVLTGTLYPMIVEAITGDKVGVGRPFFDRMAIPLSFGLLLAMGIGPVTPYRAAKGSVVWERIRVPIRAALGVTAVLVVFGYRNPYLLTSVLTATFVMAVIVRYLFVSARKVANRHEMSLPSAILRVMRNDTSYWGGQISHVGVALLAIGIAFSANLAVDTSAVLSPGDTVSVAGFDLTYAQRFERQEPNRSVTGARIEVSRDGRLVSVLEPRLNQYPQSLDSVATPDIDATLRGDLYLSLKSLDDQKVTIRVFWFPLIWLVWVGGFVIAIAALWSRLVKKPEQDRANVRRTESV
ncbi:cytochrome c-type biogenesis protein CcmF [bacterium BMS3Abin02]|nr:cytochrome c-type biogenesis protein CcmF [bacterium BMS3Abin02]GBE22138.1 cytochrome c-type biogenesis protein CcmF [bacterium BMS3Bbin01]HDH25524.1 heme lyase CcmF/NrfE family subunit [Actinomycetota bacterium]